MIRELKYKLSYYTISIEKINEDDEVLVYSSISGKKVILSQNVWNSIMDNKIVFLPENIINRLKKLKILVNSDENELEKIDIEKIEFKNNQCEL